MVRHKKDNSARLDIRLSPYLKKALEDYAEKHHMTISAVVIRELRNLIMREHEKYPVDAEQV